MDEPKVTRRDLLARSAAAGTVAAIACGSGAIVAGALSGCSMQTHKDAITTTGTVNIGSPDQFPAGTVNTTFLATYGIVVTNDSGTPLALRPICTHKGCTVKWDPADFQFVCPCHGSKFDLLGQVTHGPAKRSLAAVAAVPQPNGTLTVDLDALYAMAPAKQAQ